MKFKFGKVLITALIATACLSPAAIAVSSLASAIPLIPSLEKNSSLDSLFAQAEKIKKEVRYKAVFTANNQQYWFVVIEEILGFRPYGEVILYVSKPNFSQPRRIPIPTRGYINQQWQDKNNKKIFYCIAQHGNGSPVLHEVFRIDLSNPSRPIVRKVRSYMG